MKKKLGDFELRLKCASGLAQAYQATDDKELLTIFFSIFNDLDESEDIRAECFVGMMQVHGISSVEMLNKNLSKIIMSMDDINFNEFDIELNEIKTLINR